jgi:hypothetical protein
MNDICPLVHFLPGHSSAQDEVPTANDAVKRYGAIEINEMVYFPLAFGY